MKARIIKKVYSIWFIRKYKIELRQLKKEFKKYREFKKLSKFKNKVLKKKERYIRHWQKYAFKIIN